MLWFSNLTLSLTPTPTPEIFGKGCSHHCLSQFGRDTPSIWWGEVTEAAKHPRMHRCPHDKE